MELETILIALAAFCAASAAPNVKLSNYQFKYAVNDPNTNDHKVQVERKVGDHLTTAYVVKTIHPSPQGPPGNSYIGVSRWSGDKNGPPVTFLPKIPPLNLHPFINKFGIGHKMGLYPEKVKVPQVDKSHGWATDKVLHNHVDGYHVKKPQPKPILIIVEKRPARPIEGAYHGGNYHTVEDSYFKDKGPSRYDWPKRYGLEHDYDTETDIGDKKIPYDEYIPHEDENGEKKKGLYHSYSWSKRYGTGDHNKDEVDDEVDDNDDDDDDDEEEKSYESSEEYKGGDKSGWYGVDKDEDEDEDEYKEYKSPGYYKYGDKGEFGHWFHDKGKEDGVYKGYDDCENSRH